MGKRKAYLHIGPEHGPGDFLEAALLRHEHALAALGVWCPVETADEMFRAAVEIRRVHKDWGYQRREVEGAWSGLCRRILKDKGKETVVLSQPLLAAADRDQIDLLLDQLPGVQKHVVITLASTESAADVVERWTSVLGKPERLHVIETGQQPDRDRVWREFGRLVGFGTASLSVTGLGTPEIASLDDALLEVERLARRNQSLELRVDALAKKRRKLKRRLAA